MLIIVSVALVTGDAVSSEFEKKTDLLLFPIPQRRTSIFAGKYVAALIASFFSDFTILSCHSIENSGNI